MITNIEERILITKTLEVISEIKLIFYEILNLYSLQQFHFKDNFTIFNKILQLDENENKIETDPEKLLSELISYLSLLNLFLKEFNSNQISFTEKGNYDIIKEKEENKLFPPLNELLLKNNINIEEEQYLIVFKNNIYFHLKEKESLIEKYFKKLKIKYSLKNRKLLSEEYIQIKIIVNNLFSVLIKFPSNLSILNLDNFQNKIELVVKGLFCPNKEDNKKFNNYNNFLLFKKLSIIFNSKFKQIIKEKKGLYSIKEEKISFYECLVKFLDYVYDYDNIFNIKCEKCFNKIKYISNEKFFSVPLLKIQQYDKNYTMILINDIEKGNDVNNINKIFHFFHKECINNV